MLAQRRKLPEHPDPTFGTGKGISIITELDGFEGVFVAVGEVSKLPKDLLVIDTCESDLSSSRIAVAASKWAWFSDWDKYPLLLDGEQNGSLHRKFFSRLKYIRRANPSRNGPVNVLYKRVYQNKR